MSFFARELDPTSLVVAFIAASADRVSADGLRWGVEPICAVLTEKGVKIAPSTYYAARNRAPSRGAQRHALLLPEVVRAQTSKDLGVARSVAPRLSARLSLALCWADN
ncbi:MAG: hypothetical protein ABJA81_00640 [Nocardioidaceae bacterium]